MAKDLLYAVRQFRRSPGFFCTAILLIALGIAFNTQIFTLVNALLLKPLAVTNPQSVVQLFEIRPKLPASPYFDYPLFRRLASSSSTLTGLIAQWEFILPVQHSTVTERAHVYAVTTNFFTELGIQPALGRGLSKDDDHTAVLSHAYWTNNLNRDASIVGKAIRIRDHAYQVIGVAPEQFVGLTIDSGPDLWIPLENERDFGGPKAVVERSSVEVVARLRPGVSSQQALEEATSLWTSYLDEAATREPERRSWLVEKLEVRSLAHGLSPIRDQSRKALVFLLTGTGLLLLMVCANVGGLLLARAVAREKETAVRVAVGASRTRIIRQWITESLLLTGIGGLLGLALARVTLPLLLQWMPPARGIGNDPAELRTLSLDLHLDLRIALFSLAICGATAILSALAPALRASRHELYTALKSALSERRHRRFQSALCVLQIAICTVLLISAGLLVRSLMNLRSQDTGFDGSHVVIFSVDPSIRSYDSAQTWSLQNRLLEATRQIPGVAEAAIAGRALMRGIGWGNPIVLPGQHGDGLISSSTNAVTPEYFNVMGIHLLAGRLLNESDREEKDKVVKAVVNQAFVDRFFLGQNPLGRQFSTGREFSKPGREVVGVVNDTKYRSLREIPPPIHYSYGYGPGAYPNSFVLHVRTQGDPQKIIQPMQSLIRTLDPEMPFYQVATLSEEIDRSLWQDRLLVVLASGFGIFAMVLSAIGLYGILSCFVAGRTRELSLRMALGATRSHVVRLVFRHLTATLALGLMAGAAFSFLAVTQLRSILYGVPAFDLRVITAATLLLTATVLASAAAPLYRAIALDPATSLREN